MNCCADCKYKADEEPNATIIQEGFPSWWKDMQGDSKQDNKPWCTANVIDIKNPITGKIIYFYDFRGGKCTSVRCVWKNEEGDCKDFKMKESGDAEDELL